MSHHLKVMYEAGLLENERRGTWVYYRIVPKQLAALRKALA
ncbi:MAG: ArsR/SmtB family transcription factor [Heteroscytonema crispum UTEX LB 1556]